MQNVLQHGLLTSAIFPSEIADRVHDGKSLLYKNWDVRGSGEQMALLHAYVRNWMGWRQGMLIISIIYYLLFIIYRHLFVETILQFLYLGSCDPHGIIYYNGTVYLTRRIVLIDYIII